MNIKNNYKEKIKKISFLFFQFIAFSFFMFIKSPAPHYSAFNFYKLSLNQATANTATTTQTPASSAKKLAWSGGYTPGAAGAAGGGAGAAGGGAGAAGGGAGVAGGGAGAAGGGAGAAGGGAGAAGGGAGAAGGGAGAAGGGAGATGGGAGAAGGGAGAAGGGAGAAGGGAGAAGGGAGAAGGGAGAAGGGAGATGGGEEEQEQQEEEQEQQEEEQEQQAGATGGGVVGGGEVKKEDHICDRDDDLDTLKEKEALNDDYNKLAFSNSNSNNTIIREDLNKRMVALETTDIRIFRKKFNECKKIIQKKEEKEEQCDKARSELNESRKDYSITCHKFAGGGTSCSNALQACSLCPSGKTKDKEYKCLEIHKKTKCPELAGNDLKKATEEKDKYKEEVTDLQEEIEDLQEQLTEEENELNTELVELEEEFNTSVSDFQRDTETAKAELEESLKEGNYEIKSSVNKEIAAVQEIIDNALKAAHGFENALTQAYITYQSEVQKVHKECRGESGNQLMAYQTKRRQSILSGAYKISLSKLMNKNRVSFYQQDQKRLKYFYNRCLKLRKNDLNNIKTNYSVQLRQIEQQKEQYEQNINAMKNRLASLNQSAANEQSQLLSNYTKAVSSSMSQFESDYKSSLEKYNRAKQTLIITRSRNINRLKADLEHKNAQLKELEFALVKERYLIHSLNSQGVQDEEDKTDDYAEASGNWIDYQNKILETWNACDCDSDSKNNGCPENKQYKDAQKAIKNIGNR